MFTLLFPHLSAYSYNRPLVEFLVEHDAKHHGTSGMVIYIIFVVTLWLVHTHTHTYTHTHTHKHTHTLSNVHYVAICLECRRKFAFYRRQVSLCAYHSLFPRLIACLATLAEEPGDDATVPSNWDKSQSQMYIFSRRNSTHATLYIEGPVACMHALMSCVQ